MACKRLLEFDMEEKYKSLKNKKLILFFTYGVSLELWKEKGMFDREIKLYERLGEEFNKVYFITYGKNDYKFANELKKYNIEILYKKSRLPNFLYSLLLPFIYKKQLKDSHFFKTNQMLGSWSAVISKLLYKKRLVVRTGYTLSIFSKKVGRMKHLFSRCIEWFALSTCDTFIVATKEESEYFKKYKSKIAVIPNYVDTKLFKPVTELKNREEKDVLLFVGRFNKQKNLENLVCALKGVDGVRLQLVGDGELKEGLEKIALQKEVDVEFLGRKSHEQLPNYINYADTFVLPSLYEGNPKVLLEAMSCGVPVVTTCVEGIENIVKDRETAILAQTDIVSLRRNIKDLKDDVNLRNRIGEKSREYILKNNSLEKVLELELKNYD